MRPGDDRELPRSGDDRVLLAVLAVTAVALLARVVLLGDRFAHWDEGRVAYWTLRYVETGTFRYQPILHGPFLQQVNRLVFGTLGATDATMRLVVALVGTLLPLSALPLRDRLRDREVVALALLFAFDPTFLYYSRFMRADVPTAAFGFLAFGLLVRAVDSRTDGWVRTEGTMRQGAAPVVTFVDTDRVPERKIEAAAYTTSA